MSLPEIKVPTSPTGITAWSENENDAYDEYKTEDIYNGSKNFWRQKVNVDFRIVYHEPFDCLELISFNSDKCVESIRSYISKNGLEKKLPPEDIDSKVNTKREELLKNRKRETNEVIRKSIVKEMIINYIISRTNITGDFEVKLLACTGDTPVLDTIVSVSSDGVETTKEEQRLDIVLQTKPKGLKPFYVPRRRKTTFADFHQTTRSLRIDAARLNEACDRAHRAAGLAVSSVDGFKGSRRLTFDPSKMTIAKYRWQSACHRVVLINFANDVRKRLDRYSMGSLPTGNPTLSPSTLRPSISTADLRSSLPPITSSTKSPETLSITTSAKLQKPKGIIGKSSKTVRPSIDRLNSLEEQ
jgi:hypothetical protein